MLILLENTVEHADERKNVLNKLANCLMTWEPFKTEQVLFITWSPPTYTGFGLACARKRACAAAQQSRTFLKRRLSSSKCHLPPRRVHVQHAAANYIELSCHAQITLIRSSWILAGGLAAARERRGAISPAIVAILSRTRGDATGEGWREGGGVGGAKRSVA